MFGKKKISASEHLDEGTREAIQRFAELVESFKAFRKGWDVFASRLKEAAVSCHLFSEASQMSSAPLSADSRQAVGGVKNAANIWSARVNTLGEELQRIEREFAHAEKDDIERLTHTVEHLNKEAGKVAQMRKKVDANALTAEGKLKQDGEAFAREEQAARSRICAMLHRASVSWVDLQAQALAKTAEEMRRVLESMPAVPAGTPQAAVEVEAPEAVVVVQEVNFDHDQSSVVPAQEQGKTPPPRPGKKEEKKEEKGLFGVLAKAEQKLQKAVNGK